MQLFWESTEDLQLYVGQRPKSKTYKAIKLWERNTEQRLHHARFGDDFLEMPPVALVRKETKLDFMKNLNISASWNTINREIRQPTEWEKIFSNHIP